MAQPKEGPTHLGYTNSGARIIEIYPSGTIIRSVLEEDVQDYGITSTRASRLCTVVRLYQLHRYSAKSLKWNLRRKPKKVKHGKVKV